MIRRLWAGLVPIAAEAQRAYGGRRRTAPGVPASAGEWLTIQESAAGACRPCNGRTQVYASVSLLSRRH